MPSSLEFANAQFGVYDKSHVRTPLEHVVLNDSSLFKFLISLSLMQANSFDVPYFL